MSTAERAEPAVPPGDRQRGDRSVRLALGVVGVLVIGFGAVLLVVGAPTLPELVSAGLWLLVPPVVVDLVVLPAAALLAALVVRRVGRPARGPVLVGLALSLVLLVVAGPVLGRFGRLADNPSLLDRDYGWGTLALLGVVWAGCAVAATTAARRARVAAGAPGPRRTADGR